MRLRSHFLEIKDRIASFFDAHWTPIMTTAALLVVGILAFEGGFLFGRDRAIPPLVVETPSVCTTDSSSFVPTSTTNPATKEGGTLTNDTTKGETKAIPSSATGTDSIDRSACAFVGSKNSDKYHLPTCSWAKRILDKNLVCFSSAADAEARGYTAGCVK